MFKIIKKNKQLIILSIILFFAFILRVVQLAQTPNGFHADEASFYINSLAIFKTGMDEDGNKMPLSLSSLIDPKPALYSYFQIPFLSLFHNQIFAARFVSVILAVFSLLAVYLFIIEVSDKKIAILTTAILAISPWHIIVSRGTQEVIASFLFLLTALLCLIIFLKKVKLPIFISAILFFFSSLLSMYFYHSAKLVLPLLVFTLLFYYFKKTKDFFKTSLLIVALTSIAGISSLFIQESTSRITAVSIFSDSGPQEKIIEKIYTSHEEVPIPVLRIFYNKVQSYSFAIIAEYSKYFSPEFLFLSKAKPTRYAISDHGLMYLFEIPFLIIGLYVAIKNKRKELAIFLAILILSPIPASLTTQETPSLLRSFPMVISLAYFIAVGIKYLFQLNFKLIKNILIFLIIIAYVWSLLYFTLQYHVQTRFFKPWFRNSPYMKIAKDVADISNNYKRIEVTNDLRPLYAYFVMENLISIEELQLNPHARDSQKYNLGKFTFNRSVCDFDNIEPGVLYVAELGCKNRNQKLNNLETIKIVSYEDSTEVYELLQAIQ